MANPVLDAYLTYEFIKRIVTPFEKWPAYKLGIIDKSGKVIRKSSTLTSSEEKNAWGYFDRLTCNLKKILAKIPGGSTTLGSAVATALLLKEHDKQQKMSDEEMEKFFEDAIANNVGDGNIASVGIGPQGEPGVNLKKKKKTVPFGMFVRKAPR